VTPARHQTVSEGEASTPQIEPLRNCVGALASAKERERHRVAPHVNRATPGVLRRRENEVHGDIVHLCTCANRDSDSSSGRPPNAPRAPPVQETEQKCARCAPHPGGGTSTMTTADAPWISTISRQRSGKRQPPRPAPRPAKRSRPGKRPPQARSAVSGNATGARRADHQQGGAPPEQHRHRQLQRGAATRTARGGRRKPVGGWRRQRKTRWARESRRAHQRLCVVLLPGCDCAWMCTSSGSLPL